MEEKTKKYLEETMRVLYERADACPADSEDYFKLLAEAEKIGKLLVEEQKNENQNNSEKQKIELEKQKYSDSKDWKKDWKFWATMLVPVATEIICMVYNRKTLFKQTETLCRFEQDNTFTYSAGKGLTPSVKMPQIIKGRK